MDKDDLVPISLPLDEIQYELKLLRFLREAQLFENPLEFYKTRCNRECVRDIGLRAYLADDELLGD